MYRSEGVWFGYGELFKLLLCGQECPLRCLLGCPLECPLGGAVEITPCGTGRKCLVWEVAGGPLACPLECPLGGAVEITPCGTGRKCLVWEVAGGHAGHHSWATVLTINLGSMGSTHTQVAVPSFTLGTYR